MNSRIDKRVATPGFDDTARASDDAMRLPSRRFDPEAVNGIALNRTTLVFPVDSTAASVALSVCSETARFSVLSACKDSGPRTLLAETTLTPYLERIPGRRNQENTL